MSTQPPPYDPSQNDATQYQQPPQQYDPSQYPQAPQYPQQPQQQYDPSQYPQQPQQQYDPSQYPQQPQQQYQQPPYQAGPPPGAPPPAPKPKKGGGGPLIAMLFLLFLLFAVVGGFLVVTRVKPDLTKPIMDKVAGFMPGKGKTLAKAKPEDAESTDSGAPVASPAPGTVQELPAPADPEPVATPTPEPAVEPATEPVVDPVVTPPTETPAVAPTTTPDKPPVTTKPPEDKKKDPNALPNLGGPRKWYVHVGNCLEAADARALQSELNGKWSSFGLKQDSEKGRFFSFWKVGPKEGKDPKSFVPEDFCYQVRTGAITAGEAKVLEGKLIAMGQPAGTGSLK